MASNEKTKSVDLYDSYCSYSQESTFRRGALRRTTRTIHGFRQGTTTVEFAAIFPVFFLILVGSMLLFRYSMVSNMLEGAVLEGTRKGILKNSTAEDVKKEATAYLNHAGLTNCKVNATKGPVAGQTMVSINASIELTRSSFFWGGGPLTISRSCSMRCE